MTTAILIAAGTTPASPRKKPGRRPKSADPCHAAKVAVLKLAKTIPGVLTKQIAASEGVSRQTIWRWTRDAARADRSA